MKRAAPSDSSSSNEPDSKKGPGAGGIVKGMPGNNTDKVDVIPRPLHLQEITLHFTQRTWEEIGPGELKYLPLCQTPYYMFDKAMLAQLAKFKNLWATAYYHTPKARISNLIMLQDDLINQGGTPLETTAFTQACYMLHYMPTRQTQYFALTNIDNCQTGANTKLVYDMSQTSCGLDYSQLVEVQNFKDFEQLAILPAKIDEYAGYAPRKTVTYSVGDYSLITDVFISPYPENGDLADFSANYQTVSALTPNIPVIDTFKHVTWVRNLDKFKFHQYNEVFDLDINTNLEGVPLINTPNNDFTKRNAKFDAGNDSFDYYTDFIWPSNNRPYYSRKDNLSVIHPYEKTKDLKPLKHHFFSMPPIRKANGCLLKQRCSFLLEQSFSVTFKMAESVWGEDSGDQYILNQLNGVKVRPVVYSKSQATKIDQGAICPNGFTCTGDNCPFDNSFTSLRRLLVNNKNLFTFKSKFIPPTDYQYTMDPPGHFNNELINTLSFHDVWKKWLTEVILSDKTNPLQVNCGETAHIFITSPSGDQLELSPMNKDLFIVSIDPDEYRNVLKKYQIVCNKSFVQHTDYKSVNRETSLFFM